MPLVTDKASGSSQNRFKPYNESKRPSKCKGKRSAAAGDDSGSDWEPEEAAYSESESGDEPVTPPRQVRDPNRVPEIERQAAMNIHKVHPSSYTHAYRHLIASDCMIGQIMAVKENRSPTD